MVERYGKGDPKNRDDGGPKLMEHFLMARRLVEAGTRCVTCAFSRWDWHGRTFRAAREDMPMLDQGVSALVEDLHHRGLDRDVSVVVWGEFGRTPKINKDAGRDHWPQVSCALLAGGGMRTGPGDRRDRSPGAKPSDRPVTFGKSSPRSITTSASTRTPRRSPTSAAGRNTWSTTCSRCRSWFDGED